MLRGFVTGALAGAVLSVVALATASLLGGQGLPGDAVPGAAQTDVGTVRVPVADTPPEGASPPRDADPVVPGAAPPEAPSLPRDPAVETAEAPLPGIGADPARPQPAPDAMEAPARPAAVEVAEPVLVPPAPEGAGPAPGTEEAVDTVVLEVPVLPAGPASEGAAIPESVTVTVEPPAAPSPPEAPAAAVTGDDAVSGDDLLDGAAPGEEADLVTLEIVEPDAPAPSRFTLSSEIAADAEAEAAAAGAEAAEEAPDEEGPAVVRNAVPFEDPAGRPAMAIVLRDAAPRPDPEVLAGLPLAVTIAVDAEAPDAAEAAAAYRAAGLEVVLSSDLPDGAGPQDAATAFAAWTEAVPQAVGVLELSEGGFSPTREAMDQIVSEAARSGHLMLSYPAGLNATRQAAERAGVPTGLVFRSFDAAGETPEVMRRFLDQAAFRATRGDGIVMLGTATEQTIATLAEWAEGERASQVALAPVSAVIAP
ncbi:MAG: divergent polysaccharide deacetylase family protein [Hasllibacter sp.]